jgi:hypothetical protein
VPLATVDVLRRGAIILRQDVGGMITSRPFSL